MSQTPVMKYQRKLMEDIINDKCHIAKELNVKVISLDEAVEHIKLLIAKPQLNFL